MTATLAPGTATIGDGLTMHYHAAGSGPAVLFLHGSGPGASGYSNFKDNVAPVLETGHRAILLDSIGYGQSSKPVDRDYTMAFMSGCAVQTLDALGIDRCVIVGNSQGGAQAIRIALDHPDRVRGLVLMAPGGLEPRETYMEMRGIRSMLRCIYGPEGITEEGMHKVFSKQLYDASGLDPAVVTERTAIALTQPTHVFRTMQVPNQAAELSGIQCPVLGLWGADDLFCPPSGVDHLLREVQDCRVMVFNRCGHWVMVEHRDRFNRLLADFLRHL